MTTWKMVANTARHAVQSTWRFRRTDWGRLYADPKYGVDLVAEVRLLGFGFTWHRSDSMRRWSFGIGHVWLLGLHVHDKKESQPIGVRRDSLLNDPSIGAELTLFGTWLKLFQDGDRPWTLLWVAWNKVRFRHEFGPRTPALPA